MDDEEAARPRSQTLPTRGSKLGPSQAPEQESLNQTHNKVTEGVAVTRRTRRYRPSCLHIPGTERRLSRRQSYTITTPCTPSHAPVFPIQYEPFLQTNFFLKVTQLIVSGICVTLYALALPDSFKNCEVTFQETVGYYLSGAIFPYIVYCSYIIISGVTVLGCMLGQPMPGVLNRAFNLLAAAMFLTSSGVSLHRWINLFSSLQPSPEQSSRCSGAPSNALIASAVLALGCALLHIVDIIFSLNSTIKQINAIAPAPQTRAIATAAASRGRELRRVSESMSSSSAM